MGTTVPLTDIRPGDLIFFYDTSSHVGVYTGDAMMIHAPGPGSYIREESIFFAGTRRSTARHGPPDSSTRSRTGGTPRAPGPLHRP